MTAPVFRYRPTDASPTTTLYVDGTEPGFRSLSHWPGNTTPAPLKRDLSTGIALAWAALDETRRTELLGPFEVVANNHYDTDGVLSVFGVLRPEEALRHADLALRAAATGDFATWNGADALAVELTVMQLTTAPGSPLEERLVSISDDHARHALGYAWLLEHLPSILVDPFRWRHLWAERHARVVADVAAVEAGAIEVERRPELDLAVVTTTRPLTAVGLHHAAKDLYRVLLVHPGADGPRYRFFYRDESWFDTVSRPAAPRIDLSALAAALDRTEASARGRREGPGRWWATALDVPVAQLGFSDPAAAGNGFFDDPDLAGGPPSRLAPGFVVEQLVATLAPAPVRPPTPTG